MNPYELAEFLGVIEEFILDTIQHYKSKYGICHEVNGYLVYFELISNIALTNLSVSFLQGL